MTRVPLLAGSRVTIATLGDDAVLLAPPPPLEPLADVAGAVREALRYPLAGPSLETSAERRFMRAAGGDAVGMSTVTEVIGWFEKTSARIGLSVRSLHTS